MPACLGISFTCHFECSGNLVDIDQAITTHEQALHVIPNGHADKLRHLSSLGNSIMHCFGCSESLADINKAITAHRQ
jgi:hypothetical protein